MDFLARVVAWLLILRTVGVALLLLLAVAFGIASP